MNKQKQKNFKKMKLVLLFLMMVVVAVNCDAGKWFNLRSFFPPFHDKNCGFTRNDALQCALEHGDINHDGKLTQSEMHHAMETLVPKYIRTLAWFGGINIERVLKDCDYNKDGVLTPRDWEMSVKKCMPKQENLCEFKWFCDNAKQKVN